MEYVWIVVALIIAGAIEFGALKYLLKSKYKRVLDEAAKEADVIKEKKLLEVKEKFLNKKAELEKEVQQRNQKILQVENKLKQREMSLSQKQEDLGKRKVELDNTQNKLNAHAQLLKTKEEELEKMQLKEREKLEELSGLSAEEAKKRLVDSLKDEARTNAQSYINEIMDDAKMTANKEAKRIVIQTIQRVATETAIENSVTVFHIDTTRLKAASLVVKDVISVLWKQPQALKLWLMTRRKPL